MAHASTRLDPSIGRLWLYPSPGIGAKERATMESSIAIARPTSVRLSVVAAYLACVGIWGTTFYAIRACIRPGGYATYQAAALRFVIAALILGGIVAAGRVQPRPAARAQIAWLCVAGLCNFVGYALIYTAEQSITGGLACVLYGTMPLLTAVLGAITGTERASRAAVIGALVSLAGIAIIFWDRLNVSTREATGVAMVLGAVVIATIFNIILKRKGGRVHPLAQTAWFLGTTALAMTVLAIGEGAPLPWPPPVGPTFALLYLAIAGSVVAFGSYFYLIQHTRLMTAATIVLLEPVLALVVDAIWEAQRIDLYSYAGAGVALAGVGVSLLLGPRR
jgi:drug/metabolite transporter (DMT)-like permease